METETFHGDGLVNLGWKISTFYPFFIMILLRIILQQNKVTYITNTTYKVITAILLIQAKLKKDNTTSYYCS